MKEITIDAIRENLEPVTDFVNEQLARIGCSMKMQMQIDIVIDEIFSNIAKFAYENEPGDVTVRFDAEGGEAILTFVDAGLPYNPLEEKMPDINQNFRERRIGGLGLLIVKKMMDKVQYDYTDGKNILELRKTIS